MGKLLEDTGYFSKVCHAIPLSASLGRQESSPVIKSHSDLLGRGEGWGCHHKEEFMHCF